MVYEIIWLPRARKRFDEVVGWLNENWTEREAMNFIKRTKEVLDFISQDPSMYRKSTRENVHQVVITKHNILLYRKKRNKVELMTFFDTRQHPNKKHK